MAPLAHTLALLAMTVATGAIKVKPLDISQNSFDDQYQGCGSDMTATLPALNYSEFQKNPFFAWAWTEAVAEWQRRGSPVSPLASPDQAIAIMAFMTYSCLRTVFTLSMRVAGRSPQEYRDNFHYKTLHFLLTDALATLRGTQKGKCLDVLYRDCGVLFQAQHGNTIRFSQFTAMSLSKPTEGCTVETVFQVHTCHGVDIGLFSKYPENKEVLIPPFETFEVIQVTQEGNKSQIWLRSTGTFSKYNCEWLKGGTISMAPFHLGGLVLATTALAMATEVL
ncbi:erythroblast NAD(P)(+)--arginine ADP-ribosyltransferase-like [Sylvia atricapilla]|uniref:erythroblast NAD(P)(+)--arginine ADP-ribosyltransferase-like n=1 Tax=Sylvia atricapilla TaxID=48155 RepID=UPI0033999448